MGLLDDLGQQLTAAWRRLSPGHRLLLFLLLALCGAAFAGIMLWAGRPQYEILVTGLSGEEVAALGNALKEQGIVPRVTESGNGVMVPARKLAQARMVAAEKGVMAAGRQGFEAFREPKLGLTPFAERINYISALQNELAATIASLDSVAQARVHLVLSERELFNRNGKHATAAVLVLTRGNVPLPQGHATAIANLVASAVEGLSPQDVTITDGNGNVLSGAQQVGAETAAADQLGYRRRVEEYLAQKAESMLARALGADRCEVRVSAELNFEDTRQTMRAYDPDTRVAVSERVESSKSTGGASGMAGGPAGAASAIPTAGQAAGAGAGAGQSTTESINTQYVVGESVTERVNRGASIKRLTVAALVDLTPPQTETGAGGEAAAALPSLEEVRQIIQEAVGLDQSRGDTLNIVQAGFPVAPVVAMGGEGMPGWVMPTAQYFAVGVLGLVLLVIGRRALKGIAAAAPRRVIIPEIVETQGGGAFPTPANEDEIIRREVARFVQENPEVAGRMIEGWIEGEE